MSDNDGLSIFDDASADEPTQVIPRMPKEDEATPAPGAPRSSGIDDAPTQAVAAVPPATSHGEPAGRRAAPGPARSTPAAKPVTGRFAGGTDVGADAGSAQGSRATGTPGLAATPTGAHSGPALPPQLPSLPVVRRGGYDKEAVDHYLRTNAAEKAGLAASLNEAQDRIKRLDAQVADLTRRVSENEQPSYAGLGGRASEMLRLAEEESEEVVSTANAQAAQIREQAMKDAAAIKAQAERDAEDMRVVQLGELDDQRTRTQSELAAERRRLIADAQDQLEAAKREAAQHRLAAEQETNALRTSATREAEKIRAAADREVQEARRTLAVEKERLTREAAEHHETAMKETQRLVSEAEARANAAESRASEATAAANTHREQVLNDSESLLSKARREAEQIVASAKKQAESLRSSGHADSERELAAITAEVGRLTKRRDAIAAQLGALRDVVTGFGDDES